MTVIKLHFLLSFNFKQHQSKPIQYIQFILFLIILHQNKGTNKIKQILMPEVTLHITRHVKQTNKQIKQNKTKQNKNKNKINIKTKHSEVTYIPYSIFIS